MYSAETASSHQFWIHPISNSQLRKSVSCAMSIRGHFLTFTTESMEFCRISSPSLDACPHNLLDIFLFIIWQASMLKALVLHPIFIWVKLTLGPTIILIPKVQLFRDVDIETICTGLLGRRDERTIRGDNVFVTSSRGYRQIEHQYDLFHTPCTEVRDRCEIFPEVRPISLLESDTPDLWPWSFFAPLNL